MSLPYNPDLQPPVGTPPPDSPSNVGSSPRKELGSPEKRKRLHLWTPRRLSSLHLKRSLSSPMANPGWNERREDLESRRNVAEENEGQKSYSEIVSNGVGHDNSIEEEKPLQGTKPDTDVLAFTNGNGNGNGSSNGTKDSGAWLDDAASIGTAFREEQEDAKQFDDGGQWADNLFYAYARQTDDPRFSRFLLTFSSALVCAEWWALVQTHFGGAPGNTRESPQFFSFKGDDLPGRAWKHAGLEHLKTKWMYTQLGDAVGTMGKGQEVIPLQDDRGFVVQSRPLKTEAMIRDATSSRANSITESINNGIGNGIRDKKSLRRMSKRDSGILIPPSPLPTLSQQQQNNTHERSHSVPVPIPISTPSSSSPPTSRSNNLLPSSATAPPGLPQSEEKPSNFDFERMESSLSKIEKMMADNASQVRALEHVQAANLERLTQALVQNAEMISKLGEGQVVLGQACEDLRKSMKQRPPELKLNPTENQVPNLEVQRTELRDAPGEAKRPSGEGKRPSGPARSRSAAAVPAPETAEKVPMERSKSPYGNHQVKRGPRKLGRQVVGYVYADGHVQTQQGKDLGVMKGMR